MMTWTDCETAGLYESTGLYKTYNLYNLYKTYKPVETYVLYKTASSPPLSLRPAARDWG